MTEKSDLIWAVDRETGKRGQYAPGFLAAWPNGYLPVDPPEPKRAPSAATKTKKPPVRAASSVPQGTTTEGGV